MYTLAFLQHCKCVPSGNEKFDTHLWSSSSIEHLGQTQEIRHISGQVQRSQVGIWTRQLFAWFKGALSNCWFDFDIRRVLYWYWMPLLEYSFPIYGYYPTFKSNFPQHGLLHLLPCWAVVEVHALITACVCCRCAGFVSGRCGAGAPMSGRRTAAKGVWRTDGNAGEIARG